MVPRVSSRSGDSRLKISLIVRLRILFLPRARPHQEAQQKSRHGTDSFLPSLLLPLSDLYHLSHSLDRIHQNKYILLFA